MWSGDSTTTPDELVESVADSGIDVLCITDHNAIEGARQLSELLDCRVIVGEELKTHAGEIIGLFITERIPQGINPIEAAEHIRGQGGLVYIPHPFDPMRNNLRADVLDDLVDRGLVAGSEVLTAPVRSCAQVFSLPVHEINRRIRRARRMSRIPSVNPHVGTEPMSSTIPCWRVVSASSAT